MVLFVHCDGNFNKRLDGLRRSGGHASLAAGNALEIIADLARGGKGLAEIGRQTKYGEARIKNCLKFNLGNGYRLISVKKNSSILLLYIGTHDECDAWLEKNRGRVFRLPGEEPGLSVRPEPGGQTNKGELESAQRDEYEELLMGRINDRILAKLFRGLRKSRTGQHG